MPVSPYRQARSSAAWRACGTSSGQDHSGGAGIIEANEQVTFPPLSCDRYPAAGHPLPDLPPHRGVPARPPPRGPARALPPGPSGSARPSFPVARRRLPALPAGTVTGVGCPPDDLARAGRESASGHGVWPPLVRGPRRRPGRSGRRHEADHDEHGPDSALWACQLPWADLRPTRRDPRGVPQRPVRLLAGNPVAAGWQTEWPTALLDCAWEGEDCAE